MAGEELIKYISVNEIFSGNVKELTALFYLIIMIAIYSIVIYHFYRYVARRDCFKESKGKLTKTKGFLKYTFLYPFIAVIFYMGFSLILISLTKGDETSGFSISNVLSISFGLVIAIRITAYYTEDLSKDVAKMLPFAILGVFLVDSTYFSIETVSERITSLPQYINVIIQFVFLIIIVEWILRSLLNIKRFFLPKKEVKVVEE